MVGSNFSIVVIFFKSSSFNVMGVYTKPVIYSTLNRSVLIMPDGYSIIHSTFIHIYSCIHTSLCHILPSIGSNELKISSNKPHMKINRINFVRSAAESSGNDCLKPNMHWTTSGIKNSLEKDL